MKGSYILLMEIKKDRIVKVGKLGNISFKKGFYAYIGSALNGLEKRIQRHLSSQKKMYWHIDYLIKQAKVVNVFYKMNESPEECIIAKNFSKKLNVVPFFGCSDCNCNSHLFYGSEEDILDNINELRMILFS